MTKTEFASRLARHSGLSAQEAEKILNAFLDSLEDGLCKDGRVSLPHFGVLETRQSAGRMGRNPATGEAIAIAPRKAVRFRMGKELRELLDSAD